MARRGIECGDAIIAHQLCKAVTRPELVAAPRFSKAEHHDFRQPGSIE
jgi:hypothetical protein